MSEEFTLQMPSRNIDDDKRNWARSVEECTTDLCFHGYKIRGLRQAGLYIVVIHAERVDHVCSFRGVISPEMERRYNAQNDL